MAAATVLMPRINVHCVTLPLHCGLSNEDAQLVVDAVTKVIEWCRAHKGAE